MEKKNGKSPPLEGITVIDLTQAWAGTYATNLLGDMGAEIIKIEARNRPDPWRGSVDPELAALAPHYYLGGDPGSKPYNKNCLFHGVNRNKRGVTLNLLMPKGVSLFKGLVKQGDIVIENFTPRVMGNLGLGYEELREVSPGIIMLSMPAYGTTGPLKDCRGVGGTVEPMSGMSSLIGYPGGPPMNHGVMYPDPIAGMMAVCALLMALHHRRRTGVGQFIDLSQQETSTSLLIGTLMDYVMNGRVAKRQGNRHTSMVPHKHYRCRGNDKWIAIAVTSDEEWQSMVQVMGNPPWADSERFSTPIARFRNEEALDRHIEAWTMQHDKHELMMKLQAGGVAAGAVNSLREIADHPHLKARGFFADLDYREAGNIKTPGVAWKMSATPGRIWRTAPNLGEDSEYVLHRYLGITADEYSDLVEMGVTGEAPVNADG
jgi:crotonobetainyl-CoA:carnitine CoA-transferase CaiB-like acyl-CoA transferase